ncbi:MAG: serine hydrolase [Candidatus Zixiibacteriota bacterium]
MGTRRWYKTLLRAGLATVFLLGLARVLEPSVTAEWHERSIERELPRQWTERIPAATTGKNRAPKVRCAAAMVVDNTAGEIIYALHARQTRPIASLTKLLTALVLLESGVDLNRETEITKEDADGSSRSRLRPGERYTLNDLLHAALMVSDNRAARALSRSADMPQARFIARMNDKARALGMKATHVVEPTGLSTDNVSTAYDCAILVNAALQNDLIATISASREYTIAPRNKRRISHLSNTNRLLYSDLRFVGAKTGYIVSAGYCIGARALSPDGDDVTAVVLGARSSGQRFRSLANALRWAFNLTPAASKQ